MSARAAAKRPAGSLSSLGSNNVSSAPEDADEDDAKAETVAVIEDLKGRLGKADAAAEEYQRQLEVVQSRLDDALNEQSRLEEVTHESNEKIEALENGKREAQRQARELESIYEAERVAIMQEKEEMVGREEELHSVIQRLKDSLTQRDMRPEWNDGVISRTCTDLSNLQFLMTSLTISQRTIHLLSIEIISHHLQFLNVAIQKTTLSCCFRRTSSSNRSASSLQKHRSNSSSLTTSVVLVFKI